MRAVFGHWKYIFKNLWFVLPFAILPSVFLALSINVDAVQSLLEGIFSGTLERDFFAIFYAWSLFRFNSWLGAIYSVFAFLCTVFFTALLLAFVEKHMRIGKRTFNNVFHQLRYLLLPVALIILLYAVIYEVWALILSAMLYTVMAITSKALAYLLFFVVAVIFFGVLMFLVCMFYLWIPCIQITGMTAYNALIYSYRLMMGVRGKLMVSFTASLFPTYVALWASTLLPDIASVAIIFLLVLFLFLSFTIRMETVYFATDKIDREDYLRSFREL